MLRRMSISTILLTITVTLARAPPLLTRRAAIGGVCGYHYLAPRSSWAAASPLCDEDVSVLTTGNKQIVIVGTAHVSEESTALVRQVIQFVKPDTVMVELDKQRAGSLLRKAKARRLGKHGESAVASSANLPAEMSQGQKFYKSLDAMGFPAGGEFVAAIEEARLLKAEILVGDQPIDVTLQRLKEARAEVKQLRADGLLSREDARAALSALPRSMSSKRGAGEALTPEGVAQMTDDLKKRSNARAVAAYLKKAAPPVYEAMIGERDLFMAHALEVAPGNSVVGVVGLAHLEGIERILSQEVMASPRSCTLPVLSGGPMRFE